MNKKPIGALALVLTATTALAAAPAQAATTTQVREADFIAALSDTRDTGSFEFLREGLRVVTTDAANPSSGQNKVAEYFAAGVPLAGITDVAYDWFGTAPTPGQQYVMDFDADGSVDGILVGEKIYGGKDVWLTNGSKAEYKGAGAPSNTDGSGTPNHGDLAAWSAKYPSAVVVAGGFSLGSGVKGDGVLRSLTYGEATYEFTDQAPAAAEGAPTTGGGTGTITLPPAAAPFNVTTGSVKVNKRARAVRVRLTTAALTPGTQEGQKISYSVVVDGRRSFSARLGSGAAAGTKIKFARNSGKHVVRVLQGSTVVKKVVLKRT